MKPILLVFIALNFNKAFATQIYEEDEAALAHCEQILTSNLKSWTREARANLAQITSYPIYPVTIATRANALLAKTFGIALEDVDRLEGQKLRATIEGDRLQLEIVGWPKFQRSLISLRRPEVIKDFSFPQHTLDGSYYPESVQANSRLFYPIRDLPHETQLGLVVPLHKLGHYGNRPPFFEFQISLLKPCFDLGPDEVNEQIFTDQDGASLCLDSLITLSTWPEDLATGFADKTER